MGIVIKVENLGKKYIISHQQERYTALRDVMANTAKKAIKKVIGRKEINPKREEIWALRNICFKVNKGERIGIIGSNGAGKTTLLKILSRITEPTEGKVKIKGRLASLLEVGTGFHQELTGRENIFLNGAILGMGKKEILKKFDEIVEFSGVEKFLDTPVKRYSSGMYVRLAFAVAANLEPEILTIDEVLAVGDASFQKKCLGKMENISKTEGKTILFVSHNMGAISVLCDRVIYLDKGKIVFDGNSNDGISLYQENNLKNISKEYDFNNIDSSRYGNGKARFKSLDIFSSNKRGISVIYPGNNLVIKVSIEAFIDINDVIIAIIFYSIDGYRLIDVNTAIKGKNISLNRGEKKIIHFHFYNVLLKPGEYFIGLWLGKLNEDIDGIQYASRFTVELNPEDNKYGHIYPGIYQVDFSIN